MKGIMKMDTIEVRAGGLDGAERGLYLGAKTSLQEVYEAPECPEILRDTLRRWIVWQKRVEFSIERIVLSPVLAPQWVAVLLALGARTVFDDENLSFLAEYLRRVEQSRGKLAAITLPLDVPGRVWGEAHVSQTPADVPIVAAFAVVDLFNGDVSQARMAMTGTWREHARLTEAAEMLVDGPLISERIEEVVTALKQELTPPDDYRSSVDYRRAMVGVTARRALEMCMKGAEPDE